MRRRRPRRPTSSERPHRLGAAGPVGDRAQRLDRDVDVVARSCRRPRRSGAFLRAPCRACGAPPASSGARRGSSRPIRRRAAARRSRTGCPRRSGRRSRRCRPGRPGREGSTPSIAGKPVAEARRRARSSRAWTLSMPSRRRDTPPRRRARRSRSRSACRSRSLSGAKSGWHLELGLAARAAADQRLDVDARARGRAAPVPDGPSRPLCPGIATAEAPSAGSDERDVPRALRGIDDERHAALGRDRRDLPRSAAGRRSRSTRASRPPGRAAGPRSRAAHSSRSISPVLPSACTISIEQRPRCSSSRSGRITELCSSERRHDPRAVGREAAGSRG